MEPVQENISTDAGYEDQNDHDALRSDAVFKLLADRLPKDDDLASQPTLSRFENSVAPRSLLGLEAWFLDRFVNSFDEPPREVTLDVDVFDDPTTLYQGDSICSTICFANF